MKKKLADILENVDFQNIIGSNEIEISDISFDSRFVTNQSLFVAARGTQVDGHNFIVNAIEKGVKVIVCEQIPEKIKDNVTYIIVNDSSIALGIIASNFYDKPSEKLKLVGVTGTNGKTTTVTLLYNLFKNLGYYVGLISTVCIKIQNNVFPSTHTTPDSVQLNKLLNDMVNSGCEYCFMEVSSHSIVQHRISGIKFSGGIFTNITHDHLDFHKTFSEYIKAKKQFFDLLPNNSFALTNIDDKNGMVMIQNTKAAKYTYGIMNIADFNCKVIENELQGLLLKIDGNEVFTRLVGKFNAYNLLAVYACAVLLNQEKLNVLKELSSLQAAEGRFEYVKSKSNITAIIDYAHTPDALLNVLKTIEAIRTKNERLITIIGAGGNRDSSKRPIMGKIAVENSDVVIFTSDNPRNEDPNEILNQINEGVEISMKNKVLTIENRKEAIKTACLLAKPGDIVLVAGKGHEKYQEIKGVKYHFDDKEIISEFLNI